MGDVIHLDHREQSRLAWHLVRWIALGSVVGVLAGVSSAAFLESLRWATELRGDNTWLLFLLPVAGLIVGLAYQLGAGRATGGNNLIIDEIHTPDDWVPRRMAPLVFAATVATHIFGGSAGREGTAIQMSGSLTDGVFGRALGVGHQDRRMLLISAIAGGFGAVFGVPLAGCLFALEVQAIGRIRHDAIVGALTASVVGDAVVRALDVHHLGLPVIESVDLTIALAAKLVIAGFAFGATAVLFTELTHGIKALFSGLIRWAPLRPFIGGCLVVALTLVVGNRDYLGLSLPLIEQSVVGLGGVVAFAFLLKVVFTAITLGSGFQGGEVTPLFVIGATLGVTMARLLDAPIPLFAAVGFVAVFAGATNTPIACTVMGMELFGAAAVVPMAIGCVVSYTLSANRGIYTSQRLAVSKGVGAQTHADAGLTLHQFGARRAGWLTPTWRGSRQGKS